MKLLIIIIYYYLTIQKGKIYRGQSHSTVFLRAGAGPQYPEIFPTYDIHATAVVASATNIDKVKYHDQTNNFMGRPAPNHQCVGWGLGNPRTQILKIHPIPTQN